MFTSGEPLQEHAAWLQADRLEEQIGIGVLQSDAYAFVEDSPDIRSLKRIQAILRRSGPFVALVDKNNKVFSKLVDRQAIIDTIITRLAELPDDSSPSKQ
jgi:hypothetical protein